MSLLFLKDSGQDRVYSWRAACIDLEIDSSGKSINDAAKNLKKSLLMYIEMGKKAANDSIVEAAKIITKAAFTKTKQKKEYFDLYRRSKERYIMQTIEEDKQKLEKVKIEKEALNKSNDVIWEKIMATYLQHQVQENLSKQPLLNMSDKKAVFASTAAQNWSLVYTPSDSSMMSPKYWNNSIFIPPRLSSMMQVAQNG
jgi:hypothetical protein